jgi:competence protein ComFB
MMINVLEEAVRQTFDELCGRYASFCSCAQCKDDVLTYAMNHSKPRYASYSTLGAAVTRVALMSDAARAELAVTVLEGMRKVAASPRHGDPHAPLPQENPPE